MRGTGARGPAGEVRAQRTPEPTAGRRPRIDARLVLGVLLGIGVPVALAVLLELAEDPLEYRPGTLMLAATVALAVFAGIRAGVAAAMSSTAIVWWQFTEPRWSAKPAVLLSVVVYAASAAGVLALVVAVDRARASAAAHRRTTDALVDGAPIGVALLDHDLRFVIANPRLSDFDGLPAGDHPGRRPDDPGVVEGAYDVDLLAGVRDSRHPELGRELTTGSEPALERHWRANYYPVPGAGSSGGVGVGITVQDVTGDVVAHRRSAQLLEIAQALAGVVDRSSLTATLSGILSEVFGARCAIAYVEGEGDAERLRFERPAAGYPPEVEDLWSGAALPLDAGSPLTDAVRGGAVVAMSSAGEFDRRYPGLRAAGPPGDEAIACIPITHIGADRVHGVIRLAWPHPRELTPTSRTFSATVASMATLALERIAAAHDLEQDRFRSALEAMLDHVSIGTAVRDDVGRVVDFRLDYMSSSAVDGAGRGPAELVGGRVLDLFPGWTGSGQWDRFVRVVETGEPWVADRFPYRDTLDDGTEIDGHWNIQVVRFGDGYLAAYRDVTEMVRLEASRHEADRAVEREKVSVQLLQRAALPAALPDLGAVRIGARYLPADTEQPIGGDWYDVFGLPDGRLALVIADVAGHGPDAAAFMVQVRNILRAVAIEHAEPAATLERVNTAVLAFAEPGGPFVTCCYGVLDPVRSTFTWASAGHLPPVVTGASAARVLDPLPGLPLAVADGATYDAACVELAPGDRVVLYTDGLVERRGEPIDDGLDRLRALVHSLTGSDAASTAESLGAAVRDPFDDLAVVVVDLPAVDAAPPVPGSFDPIGGA